METNFELRKLTAKDLAPMAGILTKIGFNEFKKCFEFENISRLMKEHDGDGAAIAVGMSVAADAVGVILANYGRCADDIFEFCGSVTGKTKADIENLSLAEFAGLIAAILKAEDFQDFFKAVSELFK